MESVTGTVTNYLVYGGVYDYDTATYLFNPLGKVSANTTSLEAVGATDTNGNSLYDIYLAVATYPGGGMSQTAFWYPFYGAPSPGTFNAYLDFTGTNVVLAWTAAEGPVTGYVVERSWYYGSSGTYSQIAQVNTNTFYLVDTNGANTSSYGRGAIQYQVQAKYPNGGLSAPISAAIVTNLPTPTGLSAAVDSTGINVLLSWTPVVGNASGYTIMRGTYNQNTGTYSYSQIGTVGAAPLPLRIRCDCRHQRQQQHL